MNIAEAVAGDLVFAAIVLFWARRSKLDLGFRAPNFAGVWEWIGLFVLWCAAEQAVVAAHGLGHDPESQDWLSGLTLAESLVLMVLTAPLVEELLFRGALFSALLRRWGAASAVLVPSVLWGLVHVQHEAWYAASIAGSGTVLAVIRWRSGSIWLPILLHAAFNLVVTLSDFPPFAPAG